MVRLCSRRLRSLARALGLVVGLLWLAAPAGAQVTKLKVGWCARTVSAADAQVTDARVEEHRNLGVAFYKTGMLFFLTTFRSPCYTRFQLTENQMER